MAQASLNRSQEGGPCPRLNPENHLALTESLSLSHSEVRWS